MLHKTLEIPALSRDQNTRTDMMESIGGFETVIIILFLFFFKPQCTLELVMSPGLYGIITYLNLQLYKMLSWQKVPCKESYVCFFKLMSTFKCKQWWLMTDSAEDLEILSVITVKLVFSTAVYPVYFQAISQIRPMKQL